MTTRRNFLTSSGLALAGLVPSTLRAAEQTPATGGSKGLRICFFTDPHLPYADTLKRLPDAKFHHQQRILTAFDKANAFNPDVFVFGGDNVFAVDQSNDGGDVEENARAQFDNWKKVVSQKVRVPHHSVIGNHDLWHKCVAGETPKSLAIAAFGMPNRYYSWRMNGWKFIMLDVFGISGAPLDREQMSWLENELASTNEPVCVVTHAPILSVSVSLVGGGMGSPKVLRELFLKHPNVRLALSGHNHMLDCCQIDQVTYLCGGAVCGGWWEGDYEHVPPAFVIADLAPSGTVSHQAVLWERS